MDGTVHADGEIPIPTHVTTDALLPTLSKAGGLPPLITSAPVGAAGNHAAPSRPG